MSEQRQEREWWEDEELFRLIVKVARAGKLEMVKRRFERINTAVENGADIGKINDFVMRGRFNGHNIDELIEQANVRGESL